MGVFGASFGDVAIDLVCLGVEKSTDYNNVSQECKWSFSVGEWSANWDKVSARGPILAFDEISDAPKQPGLYAWYAMLGLGKADLENEEQIRRALKR